jgi:hypothetical protein
MRQRPGGRAMRFSAAEELAVGRIAFSWRARFPLAIRVFDGYSGGRGKLEARVLGVPVMRQRGLDIAVGEAFRYLAELPLVPWAMEHNAELEWRELNDYSVEVAARVGGRRLAVTVEFDAAGDIVRAGCDTRPRKVGRTSMLIGQPSGCCGPDRVVRLAAAGRGPSMLACVKARVRLAPPGGASCRKRQQDVAPVRARL